MSLVSFLTHGVDLLKHALNDCISRASARPAFPCGRNQQVCVVQTGSALTAALLSLGAVAELWLGTSQCAPQWLLRT